MELICIKEAVTERGEVVLNFTKGVIYDFKTNVDPYGFVTKDDNGVSVCFFDVTIMFDVVK